MKLSRFRPAIIAFLCSAGFLHADIVVLKDGKRLEGSITAENPTSIQMRYKLTAKIWDNKEIPRTEIAEIIKQTPQEVELIELKKGLPTPDLMTAEKYESLIQDHLRPFVNRYPGTKEAAEVEEIIKEVQGEKEKVIAGGLKVEGKWLSPEDAKAQSYNLRAYELYALMREKAQAKDYVGALQTFDKLAPSVNAYGSSAQGGYMASIYYPKAVEEALAVLVNFEGQIDQMLKDQPALQKLRDENFKKLIEPDLSRTKTAIEKEKEHWRTTMDQERRSSRWFTPYKYDLQSLQALASSITAEKARLKLIDVPKITKVNEAIARVMVADAKAAKDKEALKAMGEAILEGENAAATVDQVTMGTYMQIFAGYRQRYAAAQAILAAEAAKAAAPPAGAAAGTAVGTAVPGVDARMAAALAGGTAAAAPGTAPAPGVQGAQPAPGTMPQPGVAPAPAPGTTPAPAGAPAAAQPGVAPAPAPGVAPQQPAAYAPPPAAPAAVEEPAPPFLTTNMMIIIGIGVVVLVLVVAMSSGKKKKKDD